VVVKDRATKAAEAETAKADFLKLKEVMLKILLKEEFGSEN